MDGMGLYRGQKDGYPGNAIDIAAPLNLCGLMENEKIVTRLRAHGTAVGMPSDRDQGNSEVGHNAMGAGRIFAQGAKLVEDAIESRSLFEGKTWKRIISRSLEAKNPCTFHRPHIRRKCPQQPITPHLTDRTVRQGRRGRGICARPSRRTGCAPG